jgi:hypothetical protein
MILPDASRPIHFPVTGNNLSQWRRGRFDQWQKSNPLPRCVELAREIVAERTRPHRGGDFSRFFY